ncbi:MAG: hypothetical protein PVF58_01490 [Candidatus Methanofastidiosia archaeon]
MESGVSVYSLYVSGIKGEKLDPHRMKTISIYKDPEQLKLNKDTTLADILENAHEYNIVYIDLRVESNKSVKTGEKTMGGLIRGVPPNTLLADVFDGLIFFKEVTPEQIYSPEDKDAHYDFRTLREYMLTVIHRVASRGIIQFAQFIRKVYL